MRPHRTPAPNPGTPMRRPRTPSRPSAGRFRAPGAGTPVALALPALLAIAFLLLPLIGILARTTWSDLGSHLSAPGVVEALRLSLLVSFWALGLSLLLGVPLAWLLARVSFPGKALVRSLVLLPMVLPPTVGGVALLLGFRPPRAPRAVAGGHVRPHPAVPQFRRGGRRYLRRDAVPRHQPGGRARRTAAELRGDRGLPRRLTGARLLHRHAAHGRPGPGRRRRTDLGTGAR